MESKNEDAKEKFINEEHTQVSDYYKNYAPDPVKAWVSDVLIRVIVIIAVVSLYLVVIHIFNSALFGGDNFTPEQIQSAFSH